MSANQKCYYCGSSFTPGSSLHGTYFGVKESKFGVVHPVCSKKCENEFKNHKVYKNREEDVQQSKFVDRNTKQREIHTNLKPISDITISETISVLHEIIFIMKERGLQEKSFYLRDYQEGVDRMPHNSAWNQLIFGYELRIREGDDLVKVILKKQFKLETDHDWDIWRGIHDILNYHYSHDISDEHITSLAENLYTSWNKEKPGGCFGSVIFITIIILTGISYF